MRVGYNRLVASGFIALGGVLLVLGLPLLTEVTMLAGGLVAAAGVAWFILPQFEVDEKQVRVKNFVGLTVRIHQLESPGRSLRVEGGKLLVHEGGAWKRVNGAGGLWASPGQWKDFAAWLEERRLAEARQAVTAPRDERPAG